MQAGLRRNVIRVCVQLGCQAAGIWREGGEGSDAAAAMRRGVPDARPVASASPCLDAVFQRLAGRAPGLRGRPNRLNSHVIQRKSLAFGCPCHARLRDPRATLALPGARIAATEVIPALVQRVGGGSLASRARGQGEVTLP